MKSGKKSGSQKKDLSQPTNKPMIETCHFGTVNHLFEQDAVNESSYMHEHLTTLNFIVREFGLKNILEIGTGPGESLTAMLDHSDAYVTTIDIEPCKGARLKVKEWNMYKRTVFIQAPSDKINLEGNFDLILIDGGHTHDQVVLDINAHIESLSSNGFIVFHDIVNPAWEGVGRAVDEFHQKYHQHFRRYNWFNCNGLAVFRRTEND